MIAVDALATATFNWYDIVVGVGILYGLWSGLRTGLFGEILRVAGLVAMVVAAMRSYIPLGDWVRSRTKMTEEPARLLAFVLVAVAVYLAMRAVRNFVHGRLKKMHFWAFVENLGGAIAGVVRVLVVMTFLTILISLMRSPFWHEQVSKNSAFGSFVVDQFPAVQAVAKKQFPETLWFTKDLKRREDPDVDDVSPKTSK
jgi:membrane protein required for colicin V production